MESSGNPAVSFVIRTKNESKWIGKVLDSLYGQTFKDFEVIIVDSGSTDKTLDIVREYPVKIIGIKPQEFGYSYSLNLGIKKTRGSHICIISGHSLPVDNRWLEAGMRNFTNKDIAGVTGYYGGCYLGYYLPSTYRKYLFFPHQRKKRKNNHWLTNTNSLIRKDLWKRYPFDESIWGCEDYDWALEMQARGYRIVAEPGFNVIHSHMWLKDRSSLIRTWFRWRKTTRRLDRRKRPRKSTARVE
jgi:glycosyltransferase involved in cell wall biosynthesis